MYMCSKLRTGKKRGGVEEWAKVEKNFRECSSRRMRRMIT
jgi:hypothetical protein